MISGANITAVVCSSFTTLWHIYRRTGQFFWL